MEDFLNNGVRQHNYHSNNPREELSEIVLVLEIIAYIRFVIEG